MDVSGGIGLGIGIAALTVCLSIGIVLLVIGSLIGLFMWVRRRAAKRSVSIARATLATAKVISVGRSFTSSTGGSVNVELTLEVVPPNGIPFQNTSRWYIEPMAMSKVQEGTTLAVKIDADNPSKIYSGETWANVY
jgi:hypothetical protein